MVLRHYLVALASLLYCSYSYTEILNNTTVNAAGQGLKWSMSSVLPAETGLTVDAVIYQYTTVKVPSDAMKVTLQNANAVNGGYIFRKQDDWTGLRGNTLTRVSPVDNIPGKYWGDGEFVVNGKGEVVNASVSYKYRLDTCAMDPITDSRCPNYVKEVIKPPKPIDVYDPFSNEYVKAVLDTKFKIDEEKDKQPLFGIKEKKSDKEKDKKFVTNTLVSSLDAQKASQFEMMNNLPGFNLYSYSIPGGVYNDVLRYPDKTLPDNRRGRGLGLAQESLHKSMVESQYNN